jgi:fatty-acyl-CoA synthase
MTELSPIGTICSFKSHQQSLPLSQRYALQAKQGRSLYGIDMRIVDAKGEELPWDGETAGDLQVRGHWVTQQYFGGDDASPLCDGWFPTGDIATIDRDGFMQITDRSKDVIKSGGEWISSAAIENVAYLHPEVSTAVCIAARHPKWDERPLLLVVTKPGSALASDELLSFFNGRVARWWTPDAVLFVDDVPLGATGKVLKNQLPDQFGSYYLP